MITGFEHSVQFSVFIKSIGTGFFIGMLFLAVMVMNRFFGKHIISVFIRDVFFFIVAAFLTFLFLLKYNAGMVRFYLLAGEGIGFILCYMFCGKIVTDISLKIYEKIEKCCLQILARLKKSTEYFSEKIKNMMKKIKGKMHTNNSQKIKSIHKNLFFRHKKIKHINKKKNK
ncbi:MAG: hypothetical protein E7573_01610 [Ruminococcaceae bacterium]|nr:hypothetical protein [Oscillospiraceae bacterium]MBR3597658.1 spore cortex biosynthesis protein YabQ [Clostridia bacterium]